MPKRELKLTPGVNLEASPFANKLQLAQSNLIRFYGGRVQKLGGWQNINAGQPFIGTCRGLHSWADIVGQPYLAIGTEQRLEVLLGGMMQDITPVVQTDNPAVSFTTQASISLVKITDASYNPAVGDWINLQTQVSVGGIVLFGYYQVTAQGAVNQYIVDSGQVATSTVTNGGSVPAYTTTNTLSTVSVALANHGYLSGQGGVFNAAVSTTVATLVISGTYAVTSVTDSSHFVITASGTANASTTASENAGNARIQYLLPTGLSNTTGQVGYGAGDYGGGDYGGFSGGTTLIASRQWSLDHFGQDLIASPSNGKIYFWQPPTVQPATVVSGGAPLASVAVFVWQQAQIIMALGAEIGGTQQPLLVRWCDAGDFTDWTAAVSNLAGSFSIPNGSTLVGGLAVGLGALLWTDTGLVYVTFIGFPLVFSFTTISLNCGLIAARAMGNIGPFVMWLGKDQFFGYTVGGGVDPMECPVWDFYINNVDITQASSINCAINPNFNEFAWHFPLLTTSPFYSATSPYAYVKFNYVEKVWDYGVSSQYQRTAWIGHSPMGNAIGSDINGLLQQHEVGLDADGASMRWSWQAGFLPISETADEFCFASQLMPDFQTIGSPTIQPNILVADYPNGQITTVTVPQFSPTSTFVPFSARGRYISIGFQAHGSSVGTFERLGNVAFLVAPDGSAP